MQLRFISSIVIFIGSYLPLAVILFAQGIDFGALSRSLCWPLLAGTCELPLQQPIYSIAMIIVTLACFLVTTLSLFLIQPQQDIFVHEIEYVPTELMNYTLPYVVSFMGINYIEANKFIGFCVFLLWMFWITHKSGQILLNPILIVLGWRYYTITYSFAGSTDLHKGRALVNGHLSSGVQRQNVVQDIQIIKI